MISAEKPRRNWIRRVLLVLAAMVVVSVLEFAWTRLTAKQHAISFHVLHNPSAPRGADVLRLLTFNIAHGRGTNYSNWSERPARDARLGRIAALLKEQQADIVVLNEVDFDSSWSGREDQALTIGRAAGFDDLVEQRNFDAAMPFFHLRFGNAILTRHKILGARFVELPARSDFEARVAGSKQGSYADIQVATNLTLRLFAMHAEYRDEATRVRYAEVLIAAAKASPFPVICLGDFNSGPSGFPGAEQDASGVSLMDLLLKSGLFKTLPTGLPAKEQLTFPSWAPDRLIDWILVPVGWEIAGQEVLTGGPDLSDHRAVFMRVVPRQ